VRIPRFGLRARLTSPRLAALVILTTSAAQAQRAPFPIPDPDPEIERRSFVVADGFEVNLFAADPLIHKPIQMNFDPRGRLWIASSEVYPQIKPGQIANDKILVVEDRDGDGRSDKTTVFADGLLIPTAVEPGDGGAYVGASTELLHLRDSDGDGRADQTRVVLSGFGTEDTHHILHTMRWGFDGCLYFNQSIYIHSHIETPWGVKRLGGGGVWRLHPQTLELDVFIRGLVNPWGHHFDAYGQSFATDGAGGEGINYCLPGAFYVTAPGAVRTLPGLNPGSPKYCGLEVLSGRHLPESWRGSLITNDFRGNRVCRFTLSDDGAGFAAREREELIKTRHMAFRPIDVKMGPDGAIYIADWYNPIIQHGEVDFRDPRRDHSRGRIWRVTARGRALVPRPRLVGAPIPQLLEALRSEEAWTRNQARRVLVERGTKEVLPELDAWVKAIDPDDTRLDHDRLEALWTYQSLGRCEPDLLAALLKSTEPRIRAAAVRQAGVMSRQIGNLVDLVGPLARDPHPRVRLEAARALAAAPSLEAATAALAALDMPMDPFLDYALWLTARDLAPVWLPEVAAGRFDFGGHTRRLVFALLAEGSQAAVKPLARVLATGKLADAEMARAGALIATLGDPDDLAAMLDLAQAHAINPGTRLRLLEGLEQSARRGVQPSGNLTRIGPMIESGDQPSAVVAARLAGWWRLEPLVPLLLALVTRDQTDPALQTAAIEALEWQGELGRRAVQRLLDSSRSIPLQARLLSAMLERDPQALAPRLARWLLDRTGSDSNLASQVLIRALNRQGAAEALAAALNHENARLDPDLAKLLLRTLRSSGRNEPTLAAALERAGGLQTRKMLSAAEKQAILAQVVQQGNAARGEQIFRRSDLNCQGCHAIAGAGGLVGPGLESIGASAQPDYLLDSILQPSKIIKENYHSLVVASSDGKVHSGIKVRQNGDELVLRTADDTLDVIPAATIEDQKQGGSLMPEGLPDQMTRQELVDLVRFLAELGKAGPYAVAAERVFRSWRIVSPLPAEHLQVLSGNPWSLFANPGSLVWRPLYTTVAGRLPAADLAPQPTATPEPDPIVSLLKAEFEVTAPGIIRLVFTDLTGVTPWIDGRQLQPSPSLPGAIEIALERGRHTLGLVIRHPQGQHEMRCVLQDAPGSKAEARVIQGK